MEYRGQPVELGRLAPRVGEWIPDLDFETRDGRSSKLSQAMGKKGLLIALRDPDCPLSKKYGPRLAQLSSELGERGFGVLVVNVLSRESAAADGEAQLFDAAYAVDPDERIPRALLATTTTEVFLLDARRTLRYRGMIDDQYGLGFSKPAPEERYLERALDAVAADEPVHMAATQAQGCLFRSEADGSAEEAASTTPTYHERVGRIVQAKCQGCHRSGGAGPFELETLEQVKKRSGMIEWVLKDKLMPPWFAEPGSGPWANDTSISEAERSDFLAWIADGMPAGDPANTALALSRVEGWTIGKPDLVVSMPEAFEVPAEGVVDYQITYARTELSEDRWVRAIEIRPGAQEVVHHVLVFVESPELMRAAEAGDDEAEAQVQDGIDSFLASTVPGQSGLVFPEGTGKLLPAGSWLKFQVHYTPNGTAVQDRSEVGFIFAEEPGVTEVQTAAAANLDLAIPPLAFDHEVNASYRFPEDAAILSLFPHTHLRGTRFQYDLEYPDGKTAKLLQVPYYDFNWQLNYELLNPVKVPAGTLMRASAWYDNSEYNPANPAPNEWVRFGEQTFEEMMIGYVNWIPTSQS